MTWISFNEACKRYRIGRDTLDALTQQGTLNERPGAPAANGVPTRLVDTDQLDARGYRRKEHIDNDHLCLERQVAAVVSTNRVILLQLQEITSQLVAERARREAEPVAPASPTGKPPALAGVARGLYRTLHDWWHRLRSSLLGRWRRPDRPRPATPSADVPR